MCLLAFPKGLFKTNLQYCLGDVLPDCVMCSLQVNHRCPQRSAL